jgi:1,4-dihydroxy-2-naphthoyl-CoA hydrolase
MQFSFRYDPETIWAEQRARESVGLPKLLGMTTIEIEPGRSVCELEVGPEIVTQYGMAHGGVVSALIDHVLGSVCYPVIEQGSWVATTTYTVNFLAPVRAGRLIAAATIASITSRTAVVQVEASSDGRPVALAQGFAMLMPPKPG